MTRTTQKVANVKATCLLTSWTVESRAERVVGLYAGLKARVGLGLRV